MRLSLSAFAQVNAYVSYELTRGLQVAVRGNNILNTTGFTETQAAEVPEQIRAAVSEMAQTYESAGGLEIPVVFLVAVGTRPARMAK